MITIIGAGKVGGDAALFSALKHLDDQILLLDIAAVSYTHLTLPTTPYV